MSLLLQTQQRQVQNKLDEQHRQRMKLRRLQQLEYQAHIKASQSKQM